MKKLFTLVFALACFASMNADEYYLVGGCTDSGWNTGAYTRSAVRATQTGQDTWAAAVRLTVAEGDNGRFKIPNGGDDWNSGFFAPAQGTVLTSEWSDLSKNGSGDNKFCVAEEGMYLVSFNTSTMKIKADKLTEPTKDGDVFLISNLNDYWYFAAYIATNDTKNAKARLTADLTFDGNFVCLASDRYKFCGEFDGNGHTIDYAVANCAYSQVGLFTYATGKDGKTAHIHDLVIGEHSSFTGAAKVGGIAGFLRDGGEVKLTNVVNKASVTSTGNTDANAAGLIGCATDGTKITALNCANTGTVKGQDGQCAAFAGWTQGGTTFTNCWNIGDINNYESQAQLYRNSGSVTAKNCFDLTSKGNQGTKVDASKVSTGEFCYTLNGDQSSIAWYQNLSGDAVDAYPVPFSSHAQVYANGEMKCDGSAVEGGELTYSNESASVIPPHEYENGFCKNCDKYQENAFTATDGWYVVSEPWQLRWLAVSVNEYNGTYGKANIKLEADINYTAYTNQAAMFGKPSNTYKGTFDGQNHTVTVAFVNTSAEETGLFRRINGGTVKNLKVAGTITTNQKLAGGICSGIWQNGTITNCESAVTITDEGSGDATHGGILAAVHDQNDIKVLSCLFSGAINASNRTGSAGIIGWTGNDTKTTVKNCLVIGEVNIKDDGNNGIIVRSNCTRANNYYTCSKTATNFYNDNAIEASEKKGTGELCYLLNGDQSSIAWYQKLGEDQYPIPFAKEGAQVYLNATYLCPNKTEGEGTYSNASESTIPDHTYTEGFCEHCNKADVNYLPLVGSAYEIDNMYKLHWFSCIVKDGNVEANANLTADIEMESDNQYGYTPIGTTEHPYVGFFNGQGHSVTLRINNPGYDYQGLFGVVTDGARIEKVVVKGFVTGKAYVGGIAGGTNGGSSNAKQTNIWYCGNEATITANGVNGAGIIGVNMNGSASIIVTSCYNTGNITSGGDGGALSGWLGGGWSSVRNCYNSGTVKNGENASKAFCRNNGCFFTNCYYTETSGTDNTSENTANGKPAMVADATLASGELAYKLGEAFYQTLGTDAYPTTEFTKPNVSYVGDAGYATMYDTTTGYTLNGDIKAYAAVLSGTRLALTEVENVPESTPVVLKGTYYNKLAADLPAINVANDLKGTDADTAADGTMYILANGADGVGFYKAEGTIPAGKAYFQSSTGVKAFFFDGDDATGISNVDANLNANDAIYNIAGQRIQKMQKGINIINGKKVLF